MRTKKSFGIMCYNCGKFTPKGGEKYKENIISSLGKCPSCGGLVENGKCETCHAKKIQEMFVFDEEGKKMEEKVKSINQVDRVDRVDRVDWADQESYVCGCGEKVLAEKDVKKSWWDSIEWMICPGCGERKRKGYFLEGVKKNE